MPTETENDSPTEMPFYSEKIILQEINRNAAVQLISIHTMIQKVPISQGLHMLTQGCTVDLRAGCPAVAKGRELHHNRLFQGENPAWLSFGVILSQFFFKLMHERHLTQDNLLTGRCQVKPCRPVCFRKGYVK
jgi:hypothetical protein